MKIRTGFVSNSSSASFMIRHGDIKEISQYMLGIVIEDYSDGRARSREAKRYKTWKENLKIALRKKDVKEGKIGIVLPSCNYDTYLVLCDGCLYITTCNNHQWDFNERNLEDTELHDRVYDFAHSKNYFNVRNQMIHSYEMYDEDDKATCPKCSHYFGNYVIDAEGNRICGMCYKGKLVPSEKMQMETLHKQIRHRHSNPIISLDLEE